MLTKKPELSAQELRSGITSSEPAGKSRLTWAKDKRPKEIVTERGTFGFK